IVPFGVTYEKIGTIQRRLAWPLHKDDTLLQSGRSSDRNIYFLSSLTLGTFVKGGEEGALTYGWHGFGLDCNPLFFNAH
ncbi:hypothetical protein K439DRAFT_1366530, partial [Ramaria rubella]